MASITDYGSLSSIDHGRELRKAVIAATVGTTIEWYDFFLYGTAAGLVFGKLYFPNSDPTTATLLAFSTYFVGFAARPVGAAIFGHYGDRIGRKATLIATLMLMGIATFLIAFVPSYDSIGIWGGIILTILRAIQGIGVVKLRNAIRIALGENCNGIARHRSFKVGMCFSRRLASERFAHLEPLGTRTQRDRHLEVLQ